MLMFMNAIISSAPEDQKVRRHKGGAPGICKAPLPFGGVKAHELEKMRAKLEANGYLSLSVSDK
ncbi:hypothetical protein N0V85_006637 [Neurospora sp. IMI 360204]|nr:hypothetical protein N0V85_006637 [Neurospora sp. IMI 360204]